MRTVRAQAYGRATAASAPHSALHHTIALIADRRERRPALWRH
ncbi:hypothetical protein [Micromonospora aurantiaca]|nr:hypothetical protein [Micromonospora aurantiaca]